MKFIYEHFYNKMMALDLYLDNLCLDNNRNTVIIVKI